MATEIAQETNRGYSVKAFNFTPAITSSVTSNPETTIYSRNIEGGKMGTGKEMYFNIFCSLTTPLVSPALIIKVKLGASTLLVVNGLALATSITNKPFRVEGGITNLGASNNQYVWARVHQPGSTLPIVLGTEGAYMEAVWTEDTTIDKTFSVTAQFSGLLANTTLTSRYIKIDLS